MNLPKIRFIDISLSKEVDWIYGFLFQNEWGWGKYIIKKHPKIKKIFSFKTEKERIKFLKKYIVEFKKENQEAIEDKKAEYRMEWRKIEKDFLILLSEIIQINWPKNRKIIKAMISINPICPRFLKDWSFSIFYNYKKIPDAVEVIMHECCHFLYFEKWKEMHPNTNAKKLEFPYLEWHLSEIIAPIILNDARVQKLLKQKAVFYREHQKLKIKGKTVPRYFTDLYNKYNKEGVGFEKYLEDSFKLINSGVIKF